MATENEPPDGAGRAAPENGRDDAAGRERSDRGRFLTGTAWAVLLLGLWLWGRDVTESGSGGTTFGDVSAAGRRLAGERPLPDAHDPVSGTAKPVRLDIDALGVHTSVIPRALERNGAVAPPPYATPGVVGWYGAGPTPGARGVAVVVGHVDTDRRKAVFYPLSTVKRGTKVEVTRADGAVTEFTVESTDVVTRGRFDAAKVYGPRDDERAELRLLTCGGTFDRERRAYTSNVVVSAYLTGTRKA